MLILAILIQGCSGLTTLTEVEDKYGLPGKKEVVNDRIIYYYYFSEERALVPTQRNVYERYDVCEEFTFDKGGKVITKENTLHS
jgi:hypothetical protein